jgi:aminopeptidase N
MHGRTWAAICGALIGLVLAAPASAQFSPGARTLGEPYLFLQHIGNGGYDVQHYDITIDYDPIAHSMVSSTDITARATQGLSEFSLDFVSYYNVSSVKVNGVDATWTRDDDLPNYKMKLVVTPAAGIPNGSTFHVVVAYSGTPQNFVDSDTSLEGFMRTTATLGSFTMNEPKGAMGWFPNNNHPRDKATFDFHLTAPNAYDAIGNGELASKVVNGDKTTWNWRMTYPMSSYLSTSTIGLFDDTVYTGATAVNPVGQPLNFYDYIESALPATGTGTANKANNNTQRVRQDAIVKFMADTIGAPYPFDSHGVVAGRAPSGGNYALEVQTKSHFGGGGISINTLAHEIAHQWFGDSVGPATWREIWFNEGWATWWATYWANKQNNNSTTNAAFFNQVYNQPASAWTLPPANLGTAEELFTTMPVYNRPAAMLEGYHQIVGDAAFFALQKAIVTEHAYSTITGDQFVALAKRIAAEKAGFAGSNLTKLDAYFQQWLYGTVKPTLNPTTFFQSTSVPGDVSGTVPATLSLTVTPASFGSFTPGVARDYSTSLAAGVVSTAGDATLSVVDPSPTAPGRLVNGAFSLAQPVNARIAPAAFAPLSGTPLALKSYTAPVSNDQLTIDLQQSIGANEPLRTGTYAKTLTFTLSTTTP